MIETEFLEKLFSGETRAVARSITKVESGSGDAPDLMKAVFPRTGNALVIGITGSPGAGKSSLVDKLAFYYKDKGER
ncbi:MAG: methylmalonyl Co-A mutase-associated GTPase MeaB, partial [Actinomycetota bacterium]